MLGGPYNDSLAIREGKGGGAARLVPIGRGRGSKGRRHLMTAGRPTPPPRPPQLRLRESSRVVQGAEGKKGEESVKVSGDGQQRGSDQCGRLLCRQSKLADVVEIGRTSDVKLSGASYPLPPFSSSAHPPPPPSLTTDDLPCPRKRRYEGDDLRSLRAEDQAVVIACPKCVEGGKKPGYGARSLCKSIAPTIATKPLRATWAGSMLETKDDAKKS